MDLAARQRRGLLDALRFEQFSTPAGPISFSNGENDHARVSLWVYADQRVHERRLEPLTEGEERGLPLPPVLDALPPSVVQLVAEVQRELQVVVT